MARYGTWRTSPGCGFATARAHAFPQALQIAGEGDVRVVGVGPEFRAEGEEVGDGGEVCGEVGGEVAFGDNGDISIVSDNHWKASSGEAR